MSGNIVFYNLLEICRLCKPTRIYNSLVNGRIHNVILPFTRESCAICSKSLKLNAFGPAIALNVR